MSSVIDQILFVLEVAKDTPPPPAPDYTPAFIGIGGVVIGGFIQTAFGIIKMRDEQAQALRGNVATFCHDADAFVRRMNQYSEEAQSGALKERSEKYRIDATEEISEMFRNLRSASFKLLASTDKRIATVSNSISKDIAAFSNPLTNIFIDPPSADADRNWPDSAPVLTRINELATMVEPRIHERHLRFRGLASAKRLVTKQSAKK